MIKQGVVTYASPVEVFVTRSNISNQIRTEWSRGQGRFAPINILDPSRKHFYGGYVLPKTPWNQSTFSSQTILNYR